MMTTHVEARDTIVAHLNTALSADHPTLKVIYENTDEADQDRVEDRYLFVKLDFVGATQINLGASPDRRHYGLLVVDFRTRAGRGTRDTLALVGYLDNLTSCKRVSGVQFEAGRLTPAEPAGNWECREFIVPFWFDSIS